MDVSIIHCNELILEIDLNIDETTLNEDRFTQPFHTKSPAYSMGLYKWSSSGLIIPRSPIKWNVSRMLRENIVSSGGFSFRRKTQCHLVKRAVHRSLLRWFRVRSNCSVSECWSINWHSRALGVLMPTSWLRICSRMGATTTKGGADGNENKTIGKRKFARNGSIGNKCTAYTSKGMTPLQEAERLCKQNASTAG